MNCKFCGNFVPDGSDTCPVCGRRPTEDPIGKLLSENQPSTLAAAPTSSSEAAANAESTQKKGLFLPLLGILAAAGTWVYTYMSDLWDTIRTIINGTFGGAVQTGPDSAVTPGSSSLVGLEDGGIIILAALAVITVVGIISLVAFIKRLGGNKKN